MEENEYEVTIPYMKFQWFTTTVKSNNLENAKRVGLFEAYNQGYPKTADYKSIQVVEIKK